MHMQQFPCNREREHKCVLYWFSGVNYYIVHGGAVSAGRRMMGTGDSGKFNANALLSARILRRLPNRHYVAAADLFILSHSKLGAALKPTMHLTLFPATGHRQRKWEAKWVNFCPAWPESSPRNQSRKKSGHSRGFSHVQWARGEQKGLFLRMWISRLFRSRIPVARFFSNHGCTLVTDANLLLQTEKIPYFSMQIRSFHAQQCVSSKWRFLNIYECFYFWGGAHLSWATLRHAMNMHFSLPKVDNETTRANAIAQTWEYLKMFISALYSFN